MAVNIPKVGTAQLYAYRFDQLNRIVAMNAYNGLNETSNAWSLTATENYKERISYDANGNILTYNRNGYQVTAMDVLTYQYPKYANTQANIDARLAGKMINNRLRYVLDEATSNYVDDIKSNAPLTITTRQNVKDDLAAGQGSDNYAYDEIGNLIKETKEGITNITWNVYGKIQSINKGGNIIAYTYDASGNRISKTAAGKTTIYVRDASGNVMSVYTADPAINSGNLMQNEVHLYGSSRLGIFEINRNVQTLGIANYLNNINTFTRGNKFFELSNHLGNVLVTVSDKKMGVDANADGVIDYYNADVITAQDYAPFGMQMPGRKYQQGASTYRYGFNGQEKSDDVTAGNYTAQYWEYDSRIGKRWNIDPIVKEWESPYATFGNNPVLMTDPLGLDWYKNKSTGNVEYKAKWHRGHKGYESLGKGNGDWLNYGGKDYNKKTGEVSTTLESVTVTGTRKKDNSLMERMLQVSNVTQAEIDAYDARPKPASYDPNPLKTIFWDAGVGALNPIQDVDVYISANIKQKTELKTFAPVTFGKYQPSTTVIWVGLQGGFTTQDGEGLYGNLVTGDVSYLSLKVDATGTEIRGLPFKGLGVKLSTNKGAIYGEYSPQLRVLQDTKLKFYGIPIQAELGMGRSQAPTIGLRGKLETPTVLGFNAEVVGGVRASLQWPALIRAIFGN